jgi:hypothetical protein
MNHFVDTDQPRGGLPIALSPLLDFFWHKTLVVSVLKDSIL